MVEYCSADVDVLVQIFERALGQHGLKMVGRARKFGGDRPPNCASLLAAYLPDETFCRAVQELFLEALLHGQVQTNRHSLPHFPLFSADL